MDGVFFNIGPNMLGGPSTNIATSGTTAVAQIGSGGTYVICNISSNICYVAIGENDLITVNTATALPIPAGATIKVAIGPGNWWLAAYLNGGTGLLAVVEVLRVSEGQA